MRVSGSHCCNSIADYDTRLIIAVSCVHAVAFWGFHTEEKWIILWKRLYIVLDRFSATY
jgi:hypothetical protein